MQDAEGMEKRQLPLSRLDNSRAEERETLELQSRVKRLAEFAVVLCAGDVLDYGLQNARGEAESVD